jgi:predicted metal-dependent peptidase
MDANNVEVQSRRIKKARAHMLMDYPFFGYLTMNLRLHPAPLPFKTMMTDGYRLYFDPDGYMKDWSDAQLIAAVAHEVMHCALGDIWRRDERTVMRWNIATDLVINAILKSDGMTLGPKWLYDPQYEGMSAEEVYAKLPEDVGRCSGNHSGDPSDGPPCDGSCRHNGQDTLDDPDMWKGGGSKYQDEEDKEESTGKDAGYWKDRMIEAAQSAKQQGKLPGHIQSMIDELLAPKIDWREQLWDFVTATIPNQYRLIPPNKRYLYSPIYLPSMYGEHVEMVVAIDTSGSTYEWQQQFISEVAAIAAQFDSFVIHYMQCDSYVGLYREITLDDQSDWPMEVTGHGGTSFRPVFEKVKELELDPPILIYLTDLMGSFPDNAPSYPVLWVATEDLEVPFGNKILIKK